MATVASLLLGGWRTMGSRITRLTPFQGVCAETARSITLFMATGLGIPVSTTHTITGAVAGVGAARRESAVRWNVAQRIVIAWVVTMPAAAAMGALFSEVRASCVEACEGVPRMRNSVGQTGSGRVIPAAQYAALPWRRRRSHSLEILLVTTRSSGRWIVPKGWPVNGCTPGECAAREAMEEAGVLGVIADRPVGAFPYTKQRKSGEQVLCRVEVFPLEVKHQLRNWPEKSSRETRWCTVEDALARTSDPGLKRLIAKFAKGSGTAQKSAIAPAAHAAA